MTEFWKGEKGSRWRIRGKGGSQRRGRGKRVVRSGGIIKKKGGGGGRCSGEGSRGGECREIETNSALSKHNLESSVPNSQGLNNINEQFHKASWIQLAWIKKDLFSNEVVLATSYSVTTFQRICTG